jgi:hypothetical protein
MRLMRRALALMALGAALAGCAADKADGGLGPSYAADDAGNTALLEGVLRTDGPQCWWIEHESGATLVVWSSDFALVDGAVEGPTSMGDEATRWVEPGDVIGLGGGENRGGVDDFADDCGPRPADAFRANAIAG